MRLGKVVMPCDELRIIRPTGMLLTRMHRSSTGPQSLDEGYISHRTVGMTLVVAMKICIDLGKGRVGE